MEVYLARQPIFDRHMNVFGYELLYRGSQQHNFFDGVDAQQATAEVINNAFFTHELGDLTDGKKAFVNFSEELILKEVPLLLPNDQLVIEVLEDVEPTPEIISACQKLRKLGYTIALDDFIFDKKFLPLIKLTNIIKVEYPAVSVEKQQYFIDKYKKEYGITFLAEKIETREEQQIALELGYDLLQGYFYSKPIIVTGKEIEILQTSIFQIIQEVEKEKPDYDVLASIFERDLSLSYKLLKMVNAAGYNSQSKIKSIHQALTHLGVDELKKWIYLLMLQEKRSVDNKELLKTSLIKAKFMELIASEMKMEHNDFDFFLTGMFSSIDCLLNKEMEDVVASLPLSPHVEEALLGKENDLFKVLELAQLVEKGDWDVLGHHPLASQIEKSTLSSLYIHSLKWAMDMA